MNIVFTILRNAPAFFALLPQIIALIGKIRQAFGSSKTQDAISAFAELVDRIAASDSASTDSRRANRRRFCRFMNRTRVAGQMPEYEVRDICDKHLIEPYAEDLS